jgi:DNA topoisomerase-1
VNAAVKRVAEHLGNTPAICRKCYVHPAVIDGFLDGSLGRIAASIARRASSAAGERMVMRLLERVRRSPSAS